jgi:2-hydroxychromene-2-carboxylate isomerase
MWRDLERICAALGLPLRRPSQFPRNSVLAARVACAAHGASWLPEFVRRVYQANFANDLDIGSADVLLDCLRDLAADPQAALAAAGAEATKSRLRQNTARAAELGIFGAPTFVVAGELFCGNDRLEAALERLGDTPVAAR